jgi:iron complex transport system ATP-binding protein
MSGGADVRISELEAGYGGDTVLRGLTLTAAAGELTVLAGPNGSGKSTLLKAMAGLLPPGAGSVLCGDKSPHALPRRERARLVAYFPQMRPPPDLTARTLIAHGRYPHLRFAGGLRAEDREHTERAAILTHTEDLLERNVLSLSGGQRQRVYLAMLLAQDTDILLLDEPTAFLDIRAQMDVLDIIASLRLAGKTVVAALHDLQQAFSFADRIVLMEDGRVGFSGPPDCSAAADGARRVFGVSVRRVGEDGLFRYMLAKECEV